MSYKIIPSHLFKQQFKRLVKKYPSLKKELSELEISLSEEPNQGNPLGHSAYKIRLAVRSKGKGKSGGMRVITLVIIRDEEVFLLSIYDKSEFSTVTDEGLKELIKRIPQ